MTEIYNEKMERMDSPDLSQGWLEEGVRKVHHPAQEGAQERWHYETERTYPNGGKDVKRVIDAQGMEAREAWVEEIPIRIYHPYTAEQMQAMTRESKEARIERLEKAMEKMEKSIGALLERLAQREA